MSQGAPRHMAAGEHTVAATAKNCIAMAPTSWRSIEGGSSARPAAYDFLGVLISTVCTWNSFLKFRAILGKEGSLLILNQFSSYIPRAINLNREGDEREVLAALSLLRRASHFLLRLCTTSPSVCVQPYIQLVLLVGSVSQH